MNENLVIVLASLLLLLQGITLVQLRAKIEKLSSENRTLQVKLSWQNLRKEKNDEL